MTRTYVAPPTPSSTAPARFSSILVAVDGTTVGDRALAAAVALAADDARLTLFAAAGSPHWSFLAIGYVPASAACAPRALAAATLRRAVVRVPAHLDVRSRIGTGALGTALAEEAATGAYDLAGRGRTRVPAARSRVRRTPARDPRPTHQPPRGTQMIQRGVIVARIKPGAQEQVAALFADSDAGELPAAAGVRHRSLYALGDVYIHLVELDGDFEGAVADIREHPLFRELSARLEAYIEPYDPATWRSPKDAMAQQFYGWDA